MEQSPRMIFSNLEPLILASASPRRLQLLQSLGLTLKVVPSGIDEGMTRMLSPAPSSDGTPGRKRRRFRASTPNLGIERRYHCRLSAHRAG